MKLRTRQWSATDRNVLALSCAAFSFISAVVCCWMMLSGRGEPAATIWCVLLCVFGYAALWFSEELP